MHVHCTSGDYDDKKVVFIKSTKNQYKQCIVVLNLAYAFVKTYKLLINWAIDNSIKNKCTHLWV